MNVYVDTSVVMRRVLRQANAITDWSGWARIFSSGLTRVESLRTLDRVRLEGLVTDEQRAELHQQLETIIECISVVPLTESILERASRPLPTVLGTLDALHLTTALAVKREEQIELTLVTHDDQLALAARSVGLQVEGV
jgi:predicted nucleic acid-binding protein